VFAIDEVPEAWRHLEGAGHFGKIVARVRSKRDQLLGFRLRPPQGT